MSQSYQSKEFLIHCNKGGVHTGECAQYICVKKECMILDPVLCEICRAKGHRNHRVIPIRDFFTQITHRVNRQRIKNYTNIQGVVEESERVCRESFINLSEYISQKMIEYELILTESFTNWRENVALFEEHHCLEVINDIKSMQKETDIAIFKQQIKKILPYIKFDVDKNGLAKPSQTSTQAANTSIKQITTDILGLPPLSRSEIYGFQQTFLTSLKKIQENISQQLSQISFSKTIGNTTSFLNGTTQVSQRRIQDESFMSQLDSNSIFLENNNIVNQSRSKTQSLHQNSINQENSPLSYNQNIYNLNNSLPRSNHSFYYGPDNQNGNIHNTSIRQSNRSYISPRGTYRAVDLLQHVKSPESASKIYNAKKNSSNSIRYNSKQSSKVNLNNTLPEQSFSRIQSVDYVQKQVDDIQKSLNTLRNSFDFQQVLQFLDEKSPIRNPILKNGNQDKITQQDININERNIKYDQSCQKNRQSEKNQNVNRQSQYSSYQQQLGNFFHGVSLPGSCERSQLVSGHNLNSSNQSQQNLSIQQLSNQPIISEHQAKQEKQESFSEKFQKFREYSRSQSKEHSLLNNYQTYHYDSNLQKQQQEEEHQQQEKNKKGIKRVKFQFSQDFKHQFVNVSKYIASGHKDSYQTRLVLLEPTVELIPHREISFSFLIKSCKNMEHSQPLALGVCHKNIVYQNNFEFPQKEEGFTSIKDKQKETVSSCALSQNQYSRHGCYLLTSTGFLRNHAYTKQDMKKVPVRFGAKDVIVCHFNPFRKTLKFTKKNTGESCVLNVDVLPNDKLYPCVRISYAQDCVEYIHE